MTDKEKILDKLSKIKAHADSAKEIGNEAEAQAFAAMLQNLLTKHKLEMTDVEYAAHVKEEPIIERTMNVKSVQDPKTGKWSKVYEEYPDVEVRRSRIEWIETLASVIARAHSCAIMVMSGSSRVYFVGMESNVAVVEYLFVTMQRAAEKLATKAYASYWRELERTGQPVQLARGFRPSFLAGFVTRLAQRFEEEKRKMEATPTGSSTALMRINREALAVKSYMEKYKGKASRLSGVSSGNAEGYRRGKATADGLDLRANAVKGGGRPNGQLTD